MLLKADVQAGELLSLPEWLLANSSMNDNAMLKTPIITKIIGSFFVSVRLLND